MQVRGDSIRARVNGSIEDVIALRNKAASRTKGSDRSKTSALAAGLSFMKSYSIPNGQ